MPLAISGLLKRVDRAALVSDETGDYDDVCGCHDDNDAIPSLGFRASLWFAFPTVGRALRPAQRPLREMDCDCREPLDTRKSSPTVALN
jgi:hypothetical protein